MAGVMQFEWADEPVSESAIIFVPSDHLAVPPPAAREAAEARLAKALQNSSLPSNLFSVSSEVHESPEIVLAIENFETARCPFCGNDLTDWWMEKAGEAHSGGFVKLAVSVPCCNAVTSLNHMTMEWPQAFGRYLLTAHNPDSSTVTAELVHDLEEILGLSLKIVYQHS